MPGCCAFGCTNRHEKGFKMYRFPSDPNRRQIWENKVSRVGWKLTSSSKLCEAHFDPHQFENGRADQKKKLKNSAVPTIFCQQRTPKSRKFPKKGGQPTKGIRSPKQHVTPMLEDHNYVAGPQLQRCSVSSEGRASESENIPALCGRCRTSKRQTKMQTQIKGRKAKFHQTKMKYRTTVTAKGKQEAKISRLFRRDQLQSLSRGGIQECKWTTGDVKKALQLRFGGGTALLLEQNFPLESDRTIQKRMEKMPFEPGVLAQVFDFLQIKVKDMREEERTCCLTLEEMSLTSKVEFDLDSGDLLGNITLPQHSGNADHALVFMLGSITSHWKQTVAYHFTGSSTDGAVFHDIVLDIIQLASNIGLHVAAVTSNMGSANRAMWTSFGVVCSKHNSVNRIPHPQASDMWLYFLADVPHVFKNIKASLVNGQTFTLPDSLVREHGLNSHHVSIEPLKDLVDFQDDLDLKLAPKLTKAALTPTHFDKMKIGNATRVLSRDISSALRYLVEREERDESYLTTAWFIELMDKWFQLMTSRHPVLALSRLNEEKYQEAVTCLQTVICLFNGARIGNGDWKPLQTGVVLSTISVLELAEELLDAGYKFLLTSRLTQDCLENIFSVVGLRKPVPSPLEFKHALKLISSAQFLSQMRTGSSQQDDGEFLADFLDQHSRVPCELNTESIRFLVDQEGVPELGQAERDSLYNLTGYCVSNVRANEKTCESCIQAVMKNSHDKAHQASKLTQLKEYEEGNLIKVSDSVFDMVYRVELMFRRVENGLMNKNNVKKMLMEKAQELCSDISLPACHNLKEKLISNFFNARLQFYCRKKTSELNQQRGRTWKQEYSDEETGQESKVNDFIGYAAAV
ncbi:uncharacterized protein LOC117529457 isoform X2 [Thalassophryne amazonica]|uniref:uncharacterized protein LOC117529457 isoform X2 n=1 Tax=Thalassophryne amazonica TaxID=390379 RepID=UPI001470B295|nr:uncharacterized protein LOC117529457 isoform X2 [Thalassophryne amazonica]